MKKICLVLFIFILCGCDFNFEKVDANDLVFDKEDKIDEKKENIIEYVDSNPVEISLYVDKPEGGLQKVGETFSSAWAPKKDIVVLGMLFSKDDSFAADYYQNIWKNAASKYENAEKYKVGWQINFTLDDGTNIKEVISMPSDVRYFYDYLEIYLYDSANAPIGQWYSHLEDYQISENTIMTSIKLTAGSRVDEIASDIELIGFTYDDLEDFNEDGTYKGNSVVVVSVSKD